MSSTLQDRAAAFLKRAIPEGMDYVPDSLAERFLIQYSKEGHLTLDAEMAEILYLIVTDPTASREDWNPSEREYMTESRTILELILREETALPNWPAPHLFS